MPLPDLNATGDLPAGAHRATLAEVLQRFDSLTGQRGVCARRLSHIYDLALRTGCLKRFIVFGSFVTAEEKPNDVDVVLVLDDGFVWKIVRWNRAVSLTTRLPKRGMAQVSSGCARRC